MGVVNSEWLKRNNNLIAGMYNQGYTRTQIYEKGIGTSWGLRKTDMLATLRHYEGQEEKARDAYKSTPKSYKPSEMQMGEPPFDMKRKYLAEATLIRANRDTGRDEKWSERIAYDEMMTRDEIDETLKEIAEHYGDTVKEIAVVKLYKRS